MRARCMLLFIVASTACAAKSDPASSEERPAAPEAEEPPASEPPQPSPAPVSPPDAAGYPASELAWQWFHTIPDRLAGGLLGASAGSVGHTDVVDDPRRLEATSEGGSLRLRSERFEDETRGKQLWSVELSAEAVDAPIVLTMAFEDRVYVGWRTDFGYELHALTGEGKPVWDMRGSLSAVDEGAALALRASEGRVLALVRHASGAVHDEIDAESGEIVARARFPASLLHDRFEWPPPDAVVGESAGHRWALSAGELSVRARGKALIAERSGEGPSWTTELDAQSGDWANYAAVLEHEGMIHIVAYHRIAAGAAHFALASEDGALKRSGSPGGIGMIGHSKYSNEVALGTGEAGTVVVWGNESGGDYVGTIDAASGELLGCEVWR